MAATSKLATIGFDVGDCIYAIQPPQRVEKLVFDTLADYQESLKDKQLRPVGVLAYGKVAVAQEVRTLAQQGFMARFVVVIAFVLCSFKKINCI